MVPWFDGQPELQLIAALCPRTLFIILHKESTRDKARQLYDAMAIIQTWVYKLFLEIFSVGAGTVTSASFHAEKIYVLN